MSPHPLRRCAPPPPNTTDRVCMPTRIWISDLGEEGGGGDGPHDQVLWSVFEVGRIANPTYAPPTHISSRRCEEEQSSDEAISAPENEIAFPGDHRDRRGRTPLATTWKVPGPAPTGPAGHLPSASLRVRCPPNTTDRICMPTRIWMSDLGEEGAKGGVHTPSPGSC